MTWNTYAGYLVALGLFFAMPPGPSQLLMMSNSATFGIRVSLATVAGDLSANALQMTAAAFGLATVIGSSSEALQVIKWIGVAYLVWMGISKLRSSASTVDSEPRLSRGFGRLFGQGFLTSASNPKAVFFFAALFPQFINADAPVWPQLAVLAATYLAVDGTLLIVWGYATIRVADRLGRLRLGSRRANRISAGLMFAAAALLAAKDLHVVHAR